MIGVVFFKDIDIVLFSCKGEGVCFFFRWGGFWGVKEDVF